MAEKKIYGSFFGPYLYDDAELLGDPDSDFPGMYWNASITDGLHICAGVRFLDTDQTNHLTLVWNENPAANYTLNLLVAGGNRSLTLNENLVIADGYDFTLQALGQANQLTLNEGLTIGDGHSGTMTFSAASKVITVEDTAIANNSAYVDGPLSPQVLTGCTIEAGTNAGTAKVLAGTVLLRTTDTDDSGVLRKYSVSELDNIALTDANVNYFMQVQWNSGSPIAAISTTTANGRTNINIGRVMKETDSTFHFTNGGYRLFNGLAKSHHRAAKLREWELSSEVVMGDNTDKTFTIAGGEFFRGLNATSFSVWDSAGVGGDRFTYVLYYGAAWHYLATQQYIDVDNYNDVTDAVDGLATCNRYKCDWVFVHPSDGHVYVVYGQSDDLLGNILDSTPPSLPDLVDKFGALIGRIVIDGGVTAFYRIEMVNAVPFNTSVVIDHNDNSNIQGGTTDEYYHLTASEHTELSAWLDDVTLSDGGAVSIGTAELTCGSINRATGSLALEIGGTAVLTLAATSVTLAQDLKTDRWESSDTNTYLGVGVCGAGNASGATANVFVGNQAGRAITSGDANVCIGYQAGLVLTEGVGNILVGRNAGSAVALASNNFALGEYALTAEASTSGNLALGRRAGFKQNAGGPSTAIGTNALYFNVTGTNNTAIGYYAGYGVLNNSHSNNTFIGHNAGYAITTGGNNVCIGYQAGNVLTTGSGNIIIGYDIDPSANNATNEINIGGTIFGKTDTGRAGINIATPLAQLHVDQDVVDAAIPVLTLDQADVSEEMVEFITTIGAGNAIEAVDGKALTTTHFIKVTIPGPLSVYLPVGTIA